MSEIPEPPAGSTDAAVRFWHEVLEQFELDEHELVLLTQACRAVSLLDRLDDELRDAPVLVDDAGDRQRAHPAAVEQRQQSIVLARVLAALRLPAGAAGDQQAGARPRRSGPRGVYAVRPMSS